MSVLRLTNHLAGYVLLERLKIALEERDAQVDAFLELNRSLAAGLKKKWKQLVRDWEKDPEKNQCPYSATSAASKSPYLSRPFWYLLITL